jgi:hypothetical protein
MSATKASSPRRGGVVKQLLHSSMWDVLHGRLSPYDPAAEPLQAAQLPEPLAEMVRDVTRRTKLWPAEKTAVARELTAHFEDGLASGATVADLRGSFGDARQAARLIRRAKVRSRPLAWRLPERAANGLGLLSAILIGVYLLLVAWLSLGSPALEQNFWQEYNAPVLATPKDERAWPLYRQGYLALQGPEDNLLDEEIAPGSEKWPDLVALLARNEAALELFREAAKRPRLGHVMTPQLDQELEEHSKDFQGYHTVSRPTPDDPPTIDDNPMLMTSPLPHLSPLRTACKLLWRDARLALEQRDAPRAMRDLETTLRISEHLNYEHAHLITQLVSGACLAGTTQFVQQIAFETPASFSDEQWAAIAHRLAAAHGGERIRLSYAAERDTFSDLLQRLYTEAGYPAPDYYPLIMSMPGGNDRLSGPWTAPLAAVLAADRADTQARYDDILAAAELFAVPPLWKRGEDRSEALLLELTGTRLQALRYLPLMIMVPSLTRAAHLAEVTTQHRDVTYVVIALELYKREHGSWPATLQDLTPRFLPAVPPDRFDGQPLKYTIIDGHPLLYSGGVDRDDDGGRLIAPSRKAGRQPESRNKRAREWLSPAALEALRGTEEAKTYDGDWRLWPPVKDPVREQPAPATQTAPQTQAAP